MGPPHFHGIYSLHLDIFHIEVVVYYLKSSFPCAGYSGEIKAPLAKGYDANIVIMMISHDINLQQNYLDQKILPSTFEKVTNSASYNDWLFETLSSYQFPYCTYLDVDSLPSVPVSRSEHVYPSTLQLKILLQK